MDLADLAHQRPVTQVHWGGGTPTYLYRTDHRTVEGDRRSIPVGH
jgi:coproporphyrinogen III oxidase-like Fe-S oxidoreductase